MKHGSLFSGIGGFDLAAEWMGWENVFHCEWNPFGQKVLKHYWPHSISYNDITKTDFSIHRGEIDIITGGFPCQPYSSAGKRLGKEDSRHLWPEMCRAIREISPSWIVGENVRGLTNWNGGMVFDEVCTDLENLGYQIAPFLIPACAKNAPHKRERIWFIANANGSRNNTTERTTRSIWEHENKDQQWSRGTMQIDGFSDERYSTYANIRGLEGAAEVGRNGKYAERKNSTYAQKWNATNTKNTGLETRTEGQRKEQFRRGNVGTCVSNNWKTSQLSPQFVMEMMGFPTDWTLLPFLNGETNQSKQEETQ